MKTKVLSFLIIAATLVMALSPTIYADEYTDTDITPPKVITDYISYINEGEYDKIPELIWEEDRFLYEGFINLETSKINHEGLFNYKSAELISAVKAESVDDSLLGITDEVKKQYASIEQWICVINASVYEDTQYLAEGNNLFTFFVGTKDDASQVIIAKIYHGKYVDKNLTSDAPIMTMGQDDPLPKMQYDTWASLIPDYIGVICAKDKQMVKIENVSFRDYCYNTTYCELSYGDSAGLEAVAVAVKQFAIHCTQNPRFGDLNASVVSDGVYVEVNGVTNYYKDQKYDYENPNNHYQNHDIFTAVETTWNYFVLDSEYAMIRTFHLRNADEYSGTLSQTGARSLAAQGYSFIEILKRYYDNTKSGYLWETVAKGEVKVVNMDHEADIPTYETNIYGHYGTCKICGCGHDVLHKWSAPVNGYYRCTICGYRTSSIIVGENIAETDAVSESMNASELWAADADPVRFASRAGSIMQSARRS